MRTEFAGWYPPSEDDETALWGDAAVLALDASALLYPYRVTEEARDRLFLALERHKDKLWCAHQAALEYQRNRLDVIRTQVAIYAKLRGLVANAEKSLTTDVRSEHPVMKREQWEERVSAALGGLTSWLSAVEATHPRTIDELGRNDPIRDRWDELLEGRVGSRLPIDDKWKAAADARYLNKTPPGFEDQKRKREGREYGDLIIWFELLDHIRDRPADTPVIFVSDDQKEDWWRIEDGQRLGPRPELFDELADRGGRPFWMYTVARFVSAGIEKAGWEREQVDDDLIDAERVEEAARAEAPGEPSLRPETMEGLSRAEVRADHDYRRELAEAEESDPQRAAALRAAGLPSERSGSPDTSRPFE